MFKDYLESLGKKVFVTKQPTEFVRNNEMFRAYVDREDHSGYDYRAVSLLCASDRVQHCNKVILPLLKEGYIVISDRYYYSCLANLIARGYSDDEWVYEIARHIPKPDDHYVLIGPDNEDYIIYNDIPERTLSITGKQLKEIYDGDYFILKIKRALNCDDISELWDNRTYIPRSDDFNGLNEKDFEYIENYRTKLRDMLGVYKTLCYRMFRYYGKYIDMDFFRELIYNAGKYYSLLEYYNLKNVNAFDKHNDIFKELAAMSNKKIKQLTKQLEGITCH